LPPKGVSRPLRRVPRLIEHTFDANGQALIDPKLMLEG